MSNQPTFILLSVLFLGIAVIVAIVIYYRRDASRSRLALRQWATTSRFEILHTRSCFFGGAFRFQGQPHEQTVYFVKVRDGAGREKSGWVRFARTLSGIYDDEPEVIWSEHEPNAA